MQRFNHFGDKLLLKANEAAALLGICPRSLWSLTKTGEIHPVRIGRSVRYTPKALHDYIGRHEGGSGAVS